MVTIEGVIETITFKNDENGYVIGKVKDNSDKLITFVGIVPFATEGLHVKIEGEWTVHPKFGEQLKVSNIEEVLPTSIIGIERYLSSGIITGIGPVTAKKIVEKFGEDTLIILDENIDRLREIEGVGEKKLNTIKNSYEKGRGVRKINIFLQTYGITIDKNGWLKIGLSGNQINMSESYINTGSLYMCATIFLALGLPAEDSF